MSGPPGSVREDVALNLLKARLTASSANSPVSASSAHAVDLFLLRFLRNKKLNCDEAMEKLRRRREFERTLPQLSVSPSMVRVLRSGALSIVGSDVLRRPVLYLRWGLFRSLAEHDELEKLSIVMLEYMQWAAMNVTASHGGGGSTQEIVLLVAQPDATSWYSSQGSVPTEMLTTLLSKYYPELVGLVLVVDAPWATRQRVKTVLATTQAPAKKLVQVVSKVELSKFIDPSFLPEDLGGRHALDSPLEFSECVLRFWYAVVNHINNEMSSGVNSRPLYLPSSSVMALDHSHGLHPITGTSHGSGPSAAVPAGVNTPLLGPRSHSSLHRSFGATRTMSGVTPRRRAGGSTTNPNTNADTMSDDGRCSVISDTDVEPDLMDVDETQAPSFQQRADGEESSAMTGDNRSLAAALKQERERRVALEHEVSRLRLGITIDSSTISQLEAVLRKVHEEVNVMVSEVVSKAARCKTTHTASIAGASNRLPTEKSASGPSLHQLIDATDSMILKIIQERDPTPSMKFASPPSGNRVRDSKLCAMM